MNKSILCVGIATLDVVNVVQSYPTEDSEVRALDQHLRRGGNSANTAVVLAQLGHHSHWLGNLADDASSQIIKNEFAAAGVDFSRSPVIGQSVTPTSYICQSKATGSRTIVHYRKLPELLRQDLIDIPWSAYNWVHFEGRNEGVTLDLMKQIYDLPTDHRPIVSLEIEKIRDNEWLLPTFADVVFISRDYVIKRGCSNPEEFCTKFSQQKKQLWLFPWGDIGAYAWSDQILFSPALRVHSIVDTIGAGDTFIAGFIHAQLLTLDLPSSLAKANALAAKKIQQQGFTNLAI